MQAGLRTELRDRTHPVGIEPLLALDVRSSQPAKRGRRRSRRSPRIRRGCAGSRTRARARRPRRSSAAAGNDAAPLPAARPRRSTRRRRRPPRRRAVRPRPGRPSRRQHAHAGRPGRPRSRVFFHLVHGGKSGSTSAATQIEASNSTSSGMISRISEIGSTVGSSAAITASSTIAIRRFLRIQLERKRPMRVNRAAAAGISNITPWPSASWRRSCTTRAREPWSGSSGVEVEEEVRGGGQENEVPERGTGQKERRDEQEQRPDPARRQSEKAGITNA